MSNTSGSSEVLKVTVDVPKERFEAFNRMLDEFYSGESKWDVMQLANKRKRDDGVEALKRLFAFATENSCGGSKVVANVLASLYNGNRFKFDLTDLRVLDEGLRDDVLLVLYLDSSGGHEVHNYLPHGGRKFEDMIRYYGLVDYARLKATGDGSPPPRADRGVLQHDNDVNATLVTYGDAPGYRSASLILDCEAVGDDRDVVGKVRLNVHLGHPDTTNLLRHLQHVIAFAWRRSSTHPPLDATPGEQRPAWLDRPTSDCA